MTRNFEMLFEKGEKNVFNVFDSRGFRNICPATEDEFCIVVGGEKEDRKGRLEN